MTTETHAILYQSADGTLSLGMKCKTPECAAESVPLFEGAQVLGTVALLPEPVSGMSYRLAAMPPKAEDEEWEALKVGGKVVVANESFAHDVWLYVSGDFEDDDAALEYAGMLAHKLNNATPTAAADSERLDWLERGYVKLVPFDMPTGAGDADVGWRFSGFFQTRPFERVIHTHYGDNLREAIDAAMQGDAARNQEGGREG